MSQPELSSPLEWLLQSPQSTPEALALAAWDACGASLLALGARLFGEEQAETFAALSLAETLLRAAAYRGDTPPCAWVLHLAAEGAEGLVPRGQRGEARRRAACFLREAAGEGRPCAGAEEEAAPLEMRVAKREAAVLQNAAPLPAFHNGGAAGQGEISPGPSPAWVAQAVALAAAREEQRSRLTRLKEALLVLFLAAAALVGLRIGGALDTHHDLPVETQVVVVEVTPAPRVVTVAITSTPAPPPEIGAFPQPARTPSTGDVSPAEVLSLLRRSSDSWRTLWVDAFIADYGPEGYTGPPHVARQQVWLNQDTQALVLSGSLEDVGTQVWLSLGGNISHAYLPERRFKTLEHRADYAQAVFAEPHLRAMLFPRQYLLAEIPPVRILGNARVARRDTIQLDVMRDGGLRETWWVDAQYGLVLRRQIYSRRGALLMDVQVSRLSLNFVPDDAIFSPERVPRRFASSPAGEPEILSDRPAYQRVAAPLGHMPFSGSREPFPPDFDFAAEHLTFQWDSWPDTDALSGKDSYVSVQVFAGDYRLPPIDINPSAVACARAVGGSPLFLMDSFGEFPYWYWSGDSLTGELIVYDNVFREQNYEGYYFHVLPLPDPAGASTYSSYGSSPIALPVRSWLVVSPDGRTVYLAADSTVDGMGIYAVDWMNVSGIRRLFPAFHTGPLAISPSGGQLAWLEYRDTDTWELVLADLQSETILSRQVVTIQMAEDGMPVSVPSVWGKPFPWPQPGLLNCEEP